MKNDNSINPIGLTGDFTELFTEIIHAGTSSYNWFQQYKIKSDRNRLNVHLGDEYISNAMWLDNNSISQSSTVKEVLPLTNEQFINKYREALRSAIIRRTRQTLWEECTDANPKLSLNDT